MSDETVIKLAEATLALAVEIRRELRLPEKWKTERALEAIIARDKRAAAIARSLMGRGSPEDDKIAKESFGKPTE